MILSISLNTAFLIALHVSNHSEYLAFQGVTAVGFHHENELYQKSAWDYRIFQSWIINIIKFFLYLPKKIL